MHSSTEPNWEFIRQRAAQLHLGAFQFVMEGLSHTVERVHGGDAEGVPQGVGRDVSAQQGGVAPRSELAPAQRTESRHVTGRDLCIGLRDLAVRKYGMMASMVLRRWGIRSTEDFGVIVYAMIDRQQMRRSADDRFEHFCDVFDFQEAFAPDQTWGA